MSGLNHFAISAILGSEIAGRAKVGHGQISSLGDAQKYLNMVRGNHDTVFQDLASHHRADLDTVIKAFLCVRNEDGDKKSPDFYVADSSRNARLIAKCREHGLQDSVYVLNKTLLYGRKTGSLNKLGSKPTKIDYQDIAFGSEVSATEIKYENGASIDDILCHPTLSARFDANARKLAPGRSWFDYRWAILSIRKAGGRKVVWKPEYRMPRLTAGFKLVRDPVDRIPASSGVYLLLENDKPLYARSTTALRHSVELHRTPQAFTAIANPFWQPDLNGFTVSYATVADKKLLRPIEKKLVEEYHPIFNISREAA